MPLEALHGFLNRGWVHLGAAAGFDSAASSKRWGLRGSAGFAAAPVGAGSCVCQNHGLQLGWGPD